jgi:hypothetical protein
MEKREDERKEGKGRRKERRKGREENILYWNHLLMHCEFKSVIQWLICSLYRNEYGKFKLSGSTMGRGWERKIGTSGKGYVAVKGDRRMNTVQKCVHMYVNAK